MAKHYKPQPISTIKEYITQGNKKGSKRKYSVEKHIQELLETFTASAIEELFIMVADPNTPAGVKVKIVEILAERCLGRVSQGINISGDIRHTHLAGVIMLPQVNDMPIVKLDSNMTPIIELPTPEEVLAITAGQEQLDQDNNGSQDLNVIEPSNDGPIDAQFEEVNKP